MKLHEYQKRCANFIHKHKNCVLSVDMGLGKTASVLAWVNYAKPNTMLIVAPKRVAENNWHTEAAKWGWDDIASKMVVCCGTKAKRIKALQDENKPYKVISRDNIKDVEGMMFDVLIIDELTSFKNPTSKRSKSVCAIKAERKIGLTGTFLANGAIDIYGQCVAVGIPFRERNFYAWRATYFRDMLAGSGLQFQKWKLNVPLEDVLQPIEQNIFTLTADDYLEIPQVSFIRHEVDLAPETRKAYDELEAFLGCEIGDEVFAIKEGAKFAKLQTLCNGFVYDEEGNAIRGNDTAKLEAVADFILDCKEAGEPVLLFYAFREEAVWLAEMLSERGVKYESVSKKGFMERWNDGEIECLFAHPASAGHGLNLQHGGRIIVWSSMTWNYEYYAQANARLARQGQKRQVQIHSFVTKGTMENRVEKALSEKIKQQKNFLNLTKQ